MGGSNPTARREVDLNRVLQSRARGIDIAVITLIPVVLVGVYLLPFDLKRALALEYLDPTILTVFTAHFIHLTPVHLLTNLGLYSVTISLVYVVSLLSNRRREFIITFSTFVFVFPFAISALNLALPRPRIGYGFSGIVMAFVGFLTLLAWEFIGTRLHSDVDTNQAPLLFFVVIAIIILWGIPVSSPASAALGLAVLGGSIQLRSLHRRLGPPITSIFRTFTAPPGYGEIALSSLAIVVFIPFIAFPTAPAGNGEVINLYSHFLGYALGFQVPYLVMISPVVRGD